MITVIVEDANGKNYFMKRLKGKTRHCDCKNEMELVISEDDGTDIDVGFYWHCSNCGNVDEVEVVEGLLKLD
jgi:hypothetical protein